MSKRRLVAAGFAIALVAAMGAFAAGPGGAQTPRQEQEVPRSMPQDGAVRETGVSVTAPPADVRIDSERGRVRVRAPHSSVSVDADAGRVKVRVPYVNLDVRW
ncbi:MAG TPA: hypothetical protein VN523_08240 [Hyphomicrobiaceae bacterium]|jgi:hypothetical protein|nr:hypothetical protein [Hyphomicrobiaceae bacterium]